MIRRVLTIAAAALLGAAPLCASAAEPVRPIRTLSYTVDVTITDSIEASSTIIGNGNRPPPPGGRAGREQRNAPTASGSGTRGTGVTIATKGTIVVDIIQATDDAGLIVDVSEDAPKRMCPKLRVGVSAEGALLYDPADTDKLSVEEAAVIRWLGRGFYGDHPTDVGTVWTVDQSSKGYTDVERYRVVSREATRVTLNYGLEESTTLAGGYAGSREGSLVYDTALVVPVKADFDAVAHRLLAEGYNTKRTSVRLTLTADSFAPKQSSQAPGTR